MKRLSLRPYHGQIVLFTDLEELRRYYKRCTKRPYPYEDDPNGGRFILIETNKLVQREFLVFAKTPACLAHEFAHVLLIVFRTIGHDPREGDGEAFCYMLSQLMIEA